MKIIATVTFICLSTLAFADGEIPEALGNVSGVVVNPFTESARFELTWAPLSNCRQSKSDWRFYECDAKGAVVTLFAATGKTSKISFEKCFVMADDSPESQNRQYIFNGIYTEEGGGLHATTQGQLVLSYKLSSPSDVRGRFTLKDYEVAYALAGKRRATTFQR